MKLHKLIAAFGTVLALAAGTSAWAYPQTYQRTYPSPSPSRQTPRTTRILADRLETTVERVTETAENGRSYRWGERSALARLQEFQTAARRFNGQMQIPSYPRQRQADFAQLQISYERAAEAFPRLRAYWYARPEFDRVVTLMSRLGDAMNYQGRVYQGPRLNQPRGDEGYHDDNGRD